MARYSGPRLKIIRRLGTSLPGLMRTDPELRRPYPPGQHGPTKRVKLSEFGIRLKEKQKLRYNYCMSEKQLRKFVKNATAKKGNPGINLLQALESRLDNAVFRAGFASTILAARQMTRHGHILVNGKKIDIPSYPLKVGDVLSPKANSKMVEKIRANRKDPNNLAMPSFLEVDEANLAVKFTMAPAREDVPVVVDEQLIIEYYSTR